MRAGLIRVIVIAALALLLALLFIFLLSGRVNATHEYAFTSSSSDVVSAIVASTPITSSQSNSGPDPAIVAAIIGAVGAIIVAFIGGVFVVYQVRKSQSQHKPESGPNHATFAMLFTRKHPRTYRKALRNDPNIAFLQILGMSEPLKVLRMYVPIRLYSDAGLGFKLDPDLLAAEAQRDPNALFRAEQERLENRVRAATNPIEVIRTKTHCIILGDPGAGKTTFLKHLALRSAYKQLTGLPNLPIHIELNAFANSGDSDLLDFAATAWENKYRIPKAKALTYMEKHLDAGKALLLLDALDETVIGETGDAAEASYKRIVDAIQKVATRYPRSPTVVTARMAGYYQRETRLTGFTELEVLDFRPRDIQRFVNYWFARYPDPQKRAKREDLKARLARNPRIEKLAATPLLLTLIVLVYESELELPDRRAELYKQCVDSLLTKWDASRDIRRRRDFKPEHKRQLLEEVAWYFHSRGWRYFRESDLLAVIADFLPTVGLSREQNRLVLDEIATENGLLKEQAKGWYGFLHLTLQEYFVALQASDQNQIDTLLAHRGDPWWEEVISLYAGHISDASLLLQKLVELSSEVPFQEDIFHTNLILAGRCLAARPVVRQTSLREEITSHLFDILMNTPYSFTRRRIVEILVEIRETNVNVRLLNLLSDQQINLPDRQFIAYTLGESNERSLPPLLTPLLSNQHIDPAIRRDIAFALDRLSERSLVPASFAPTLLPLLTDQQLDPEIRRNIAYTLGDLEEGSLAPALLPLLSNLQIDWKVRRGIAYALALSDELSIVPKLLSLLFDKKIELLVRKSIATALVELGQYELPLISKLLKLISHQRITRFVPKRITNILDTLSKPWITPILVWLLSNEKLDPYIRGSIVRNLGSISTTYRVRKLRRLLFKKQLHIYVRGEVAQALGDLGKPNMVLSKLVSLLFDAQLHPFVRWNVAQALGNLDERSVVPKLQSLLSDPELDPLFRASLVQALGDLGEHSIAPKLVQLLSDSQLDLLLYRSFVDVLGNLDERSGGTEVLQDLSYLQTNCVVRVSFAKVLGRSGNRSVVPNMLPLLSNSQLEPNVRQSIVDALSELGSRSLVPELLPLLSNPQLELEIRKRIANAIAKLADDAETVQRLYTLLQTSDIADSIHNALWKVSRRAGVRVLMTDGPVGKQIEIVKWGNESESKDKTITK